MPIGMTRWSSPEEGANRGTAMDARITLCSHLDHAGSETPTGPAVAAVIEAIATAAISLSDLIADGPLAGITGRISGVNSDGDHQKDIDLAADAMMRAALRAAPVAAVLSEELDLPEVLDGDASALSTSGRSSSSDRTAATGAVRNAARIIASAARSISF